MIASHSDGESPLGRWLALARRLGAPDGPARELGERLVAAYTDGTRHHHNIGHVVDVLDAIAALLGPLAPAEADLAVWFHDAIYDGKAGDDERASAELARHELEGLGLAAGLITRVTELVLATATHGCDSGDPVAAAFLDADLSVLGSAMSRYDTYVTGVRKEYAHLDDAAWTAGRAAVLRSLLNRERLFSSVTGRELWEARARANMERELDELTDRAG